MSSKTEREAQRDQNELSALLFEWLSLVHGVQDSLQRLADWLEGAADRDVGDLSYAEKQTAIATEKITRLKTLAWKLPKILSLPVPPI